MAEIPIERKGGRSWLPLLLLALLALALLAYCFRNRGNDAVTTAPADSTSAMSAAPGAMGDSAAGGAMAGGAMAGGAVAAFEQFVAQRDTSNETEGQHQYTAEGVRRLAAALEQVAGTKPSVQVYADSMRSSVDRLQRSSTQDVHADDAKAAFNAAVSAMQAIDKDRGRTRDVAPMRAIAAELSSQRPLLPQLGVVDRFFKAARDAMQAMGAA